jgi:hypothetical protein
MGDRITPETCAPSILGPRFVRRLAAMREVGILVFFQGSRSS